MESAPRGAASKQRVALVIGNTKYGVGALPAHLFDVPRQHGDRLRETIALARDGRNAIEIGRG